jgi:ribosomal protein L11 methyltransferase
VIRLALRVSAEHADVVLAELLELVPAGVEEVRLTADGEAPCEAHAATGLGGVVDEALGGVVEYAVYGSPGELPELPAFHAALADVLIEVSTSEVADDWDERWKQFHRPVLIERRGHSLHVRPPWMPSSDGDGVEEIVIDPGQAFGTGAHPTTRMCLELLLELSPTERARGPVIDVGAGSGVLAIAAARLGYEPVLALDSDPESVTAIARNAAANGVAVQARRFDLRRESLLPAQPPVPARSSVAARLPAPPPLVVLANLMRPLLLDLSESIAYPPAYLIASGLLCEEVDEVASVFVERLSLREQVRCEQGEWAALLLTRS